MSSSSLGENALLMLEGDVQAALRLKSNRRAFLNTHKTH